MNKTVTINLSGVVFHIEEQAYEILKQYLDSIKRYFSQYKDNLEIIADIENRIAEKFSGKLSASKQVITEEDVKELISSMGTASDFATAEKQEQTTEEGAPKTEKENESNGPKKVKRLYRDKNNKVLGGVASGIAAYFGIDTTWVRLLLLICLFVYGSGILIYLVLWIAMPEADFNEEEFKQQQIENQLKEKKLFRDTQDKVIGGVSGGLAAYFGIDPVWIRVLFACSIFFWGTGILLYMVLWIIIPEAKTISDRVQMKGSPVTLSNIEAKIKEGINEKDSEEESTLTKIILFPFRLIGAIIGGFGKMLGKILRVVASIFMIMVGFIFIVISLALIVGAGAIILAPVFNIRVDRWQDVYGIPLSLLFENEWMYHWGIVVSVLAIGIPAVILFCSGFYFIIRRFFLNKFVTLSLISVWILASILTAGIVAYLVTQFDAKYEVKKLETLDLSNASSYYLSLNELKEPEFQKVSMLIVGHDKNITELEQNITWKGPHSQDKMNTTGWVQYNYTAKDSALKFDSHFKFENKPLFRKQDVELVLKVPYGQQIKFDKDIQKILANEVTDWNLTDLSSVDWRVSEDGIVCISCKDSIKLDYDVKSSTNYKIVYGKNGKVFKITVNDDESENKEEADQSGYDDEEEEDDESFDFDFNFSVDDNDFSLIGGKKIKDGESFEGDLNVMIGGVEIGNDCNVKGDIHASVGGVKIGTNSNINGNFSVAAGGIDIGSSTYFKGDISVRAGGMQANTNTIIDGKINVSNGGVKIKTGSKVGSIDVNNGGVKIGKKSVCTGSVEVTNGGIDLNGATVADVVSLKRGELKVRAGSHLIKGIKVINDDTSDDPTEVHIYKDARVDGKIHTEGNVELYIYEGADVTAEITGNKPVRK